VPASEVDQRGHEAALLTSNGAAESFVSFIPLFDGLVLGSRNYAGEASAAKAGIAFVGTSIGTNSRAGNK
jgi:hypothetical protein